MYQNPWYFTVTRHIFRNLWESIRYFVLESVSDEKRQQFYIRNTITKNPKFLEFYFSSKNAPGSARLQEIIDIGFCLPDEQKYSNICCKINHFVSFLYFPSDFSKRNKIPKISDFLQFHFLYKIVVTCPWTHFLEQNNELIFTHSEKCDGLQ